MQLAPADRTLKIPHMGWNELNIVRPHPLTDGMAPKAEAYFVHSNHFCATDPADVIATTDYGAAITAMIVRGNIVGTQFHPEKKPGRWPCATWPFSEVEPMRILA